MELETLFTGSKWDIIKELSKGPKTPLELAKVLKTSNPNVSQQLRILELADLVKKVRNKGTEKGRPETRYSLTKNFSYLICINSSLTDKKIIEMKENQSITLNIWFIQNQEMHYYLQKFFWGHEEIFRSSELVGFVDSKKNDIELLIINENPERLMGAFENLEISKDDNSKKIKGIFFTKEEALKFSRNDSSFQNLLNKVHPLHDQNNFLNKLKEEKNEQAV